MPENEELFPGGENPEEPIDMEEIRREQSERLRDVPVDELLGFDPEEASDLTRFAQVPVPMPTLTTHSVPDRQPPYAPHAEVGVLGGMLSHPIFVKLGVHMLDESVFYGEVNRRIFRAIEHLFRRGQAVNVGIVCEELQKTGEYESVGGEKVLLETRDGAADTTTEEQFQTHALQVRDKATLRRLVEAASQIIRDSYEVGERTVDDVLAESLARMDQVMEGHEGSAKPIMRRLYRAFELIENRQGGSEPSSYVRSGWEYLDEIIGGFKVGDVTIIVGRAGVGKTSLVTGWALDAAVRGESGVYIFTPEHSVDELIELGLCQEALVNTLKMQTNGKMTDDDFVRLAQAAGNLNGAPLYLDDKDPLPLGYLASRIRLLKAQEPRLRLVVIDRLELLELDEANLNLPEMLYSWAAQNAVWDRIAKKLRRLAEDQQVAILATCQLDSEADKRRPPFPRLSDLPGRGALQNNCRTVIGVHRWEQFYTPKGAREKGNVGLTQLDILKGPPGQFHAYFRQDSVRFEPFSKLREQEEGIKRNGRGY